jgi:hypothetical protein
VVVSDSLQFDLFDGIVEVFTKNGPRYNLLQSAIIELFEFIMKVPVLSA